jgi:hypothetical protein
MLFAKARVLMIKAAVGLHTMVRPLREGDTPATRRLARVAVDWGAEALRGPSEACPSSRQEGEAMELAEFLEAFSPL